MPDSSQRQNKNGIYRPRFVIPHTQKSSLTMITPNELTKTLFKFYPILIMLECTLNYALWINDDLCLPFIHLILFCLISELFNKSNEEQTYLQYSILEVLSKNIAFLFKRWIGLVSACILLCSSFYYISTVYEDINSYEKPTLDDIVIVLESVLNKLEIIKNESLGKRIRVSNFKTFVKLLFILTPLQFTIFKYISTTTYVTCFIILSLIYYSIWFQAMLKLFWRMIFVRRMYYFASSIFSNNNFPIGKTLCMEDVVKYEPLKFQVPFSKTINLMEKSAAKEILLKLYPIASDLPKLKLDLSPSQSINIIELKIIEKQRRWGVDDWDNYMLPSDGYTFSINVNDSPKKIENPIHLNILKTNDWEWLDDNWVISDWCYSDSNWNYIGNYESLETYTRFRLWKKRLYQS
ncbi:hypothetical protein TPHA_0I01650 [Tetrapisispora phaffii CBS 4417]|uniref:TECPR1-like DysF domain-containing protein n=1 Tax=Tetrapisispora phaffii (strain ATCC 24235 / CBS 4417 / NBRC 1672 / NRRL Y-8282 / UCD 70-5) TaxID=1071381 RepID=G8BXP1_TETPH|nr:hypothetical protein TPHA_0I01650 [Tetrapisispora phaffii CBS 4417]CCE64669.1 hypothetical protein TPHA_0I01650 [Tetrapisispora phaffii CBS 4417]